VIALVLKFNYEAFFRDLLDEVSKFADKMIDEMYEQSVSRFNTEKAKSDTQKFPAVISEKVVRAKIRYGAWAIMDSYGTGSLMDKDNPYLKDYVGGKTWNAVRTSNTIVGRPKGKYINIFGKEAESKGKLEGQSVEHIVKPRRPSNGIAYMERDYIRKNWTKVDDGLKQLIIKFMKTKAHKYFYNTK
jgi:hypothetical protein